MVSIFLKPLTKWIVATTAGAILLFGCKKHHPASSSGTVGSDTTSFWDAAVGHYKVYDSTGEFIYEMDITHIHIDQFTDSLKFENFDGNFTFTERQNYPNNYPTYINIGSHDTLYDVNHKRWKLTGVTDAYYDNMQGDTIPLLFHKTNINYWVYDVVPYFSAVIKQIAVKQH